MIRDGDPGCYLCSPSSRGSYLCGVHRALRAARIQDALEATPKRGEDFVRQGAGPWHRPGAACAPPKPDHFYHLDPSAGPDALPAIGRPCPDCFPGTER